MRMLQLVAGLPSGGGLSESVPALCLNLQKLGHAVTLVTVGDELSSAAMAAQVAGVRVVRFKACWPHFLFFSWGMLWGLNKEVQEVDVVHVHSQWTFPVWWGAWLALRYQKTLVMSPRGCLDPVRLKHSAWKKWLVGWMDRWLLRRADVVHATCEEENAWVQAFLKLETGNLKLGGALRSERPKIVVIPNGVGEVLKF